jgi:hypothetical protein
LEVVKLTRIPRKVFIDAKSPTTQSTEAVKQLIAYHHHGEEPKEMPDFYQLSGEMVLVLSNKKDAYYVVTPKACSCPAATYHPGQPCKHRAKFFVTSNPHRISLAETLEQADKNLSKMPKSYQRMVRMAREAAETPEEETITRYEDNIARCRQVSDEERKAKRDTARVRIEEAKRQAAEKKTCQAAARASDESFKPVLPVSEVA